MRTEIYDMFCDCARRPNRESHVSEVWTHDGLTDAEKKIRYGSNADQLPLEIRTSEMVSLVGY